MFSLLLSTFILNIWHVDIGIDFLSCGFDHRQLSGN